MNNTTQNGGTSPLDDAKTSNTRNSSEFSPNYYQKIHDAINPYSSKKDNIYQRLNDSHGMAIDGLMGQITMLQDLAGSMPRNGDLEIGSHSLACFAEVFHRQLNVLDIIHGEFFTQVIKQKEQDKETISHCESVISEQASKIVELERTLAKLKGGIA